MSAGFCNREKKRRFRRATNQHSDEKGWTGHGASTAHGGLFKIVAQSLIPPHHPPAMRVGVPKLWRVIPEQSPFVPVRERVASDPVGAVCSCFARSSRTRLPKMPKLTKPAPAPKDSACICAVRAASSLPHRHPFAAFSAQVAGHDDQPAQAVARHVSTGARCCGRASRTPR